MTPDRDQSHLFPVFRLQIGLVAAYLNAYLAKNHPGMSAKVIEGFRPQARQKELYAQGRTKPGKIVTHKNGTTNPSNHQSALAVDFGIFKDGKYIEEPPQDIWEQLQHAAHVQKLVSGLDWTGFKDAPHVEWDTDDHDTYDAAHEWKASVGLV